MKKIVIASVLMSGLLSAESGVYFGMDVGAVSSTTTLEDSGYTYEGDNDYSDVKLKLGVGTDGGTKFQGVLSYATFDQYVFSGKSKELTEIGFEIIQEFQGNGHLYPFLKLGFGLGSMDVDGYADSTIHSFSYNVGAGLSYEAVDRIYLLFGLDYIGRKWEDIRYYYDYNYYSISTSDSGFKPYVGMNYRF